MTILSCAEENADRVFLVGECNPYGADPEFALYPWPANCSGHRLWQILGVEEDRYLSFRRVNLCAGAWSRREAVAGAGRLYDEIRGLPADPGSGDPVRPLVILLGSRVSDALGVYTIRDRSGIRSPGRLGAWEHGEDALGSAGWLSLPHPSGLNRAWGSGMWSPSGTVARARRLLVDLAPRVPWGKSRPLVDGAEPSSGRDSGHG